MDARLGPPPEQRGRDWGGEPEHEAGEFAEIEDSYKNNVRCKITEGQV